MFISLSPSLFLPPSLPLPFSLFPQWLGNRYGNRLFALKVSALEVRCRLATNTVDQAVPVLFEVREGVGCSVGG